ncbi:TPA: helix-turn-helix domain-containing protein [Legionella pneumophila]
MSTFLMKEKHPNLIKIGKIIRDTRKAKGYSQEDFASQAQLGRTYMGRIERGEQNMSIQTLIQIALVLEVEVPALFPKLKDLILPKESSSPK